MNTEHLVLPSVPSERKALTKKDIFKIASNPDTCPVTPWQLKDEVTIGEIQKQTPAFAKAVIEASGGTFNNSTN